MGWLKRKKEREKTIWLATNNQNKAREFRQILTGWTIKTLDDLVTDKLDIQETGKTFAENALIKAKALAAIVHEPCIGEDSGLCVDKLKGFPGIYSKRWAAPVTDYKKINQMLLDKMKEKGLTAKKDRGADFITVIGYYDPHKDEEKTFTGKLRGRITDTPRGDDHFGYDPIFQPLRYDQTFAEMTPELKNKISQRRTAIEKLKSFLNNKWPGMNLMNNILIWIFSGED